ncbi:MAG: hypothetical protein AB1450_13425 [Pseudomonadota bacterium]
MDADRPIEGDGIGRFSERLALLVGDEPLRSFAARAGVAEGTLRNLLRGGEPKLSNLLRIVQAADSSLDWLAAGKGEMRAGAQQIVSPDIEQLGIALAAVESILDRQRLHLAAQKRLQLAWLALDYMKADKAQEEVASFIARLISVAS